MYVYVWMCGCVCTYVCIYTYMYGLCVDICMYVRVLQEGELLCDKCRKLSYSEYVFAISIYGDICVCMNVYK